MMDEIMIPVDPSCIPEGWEAQRFGYGETGETVVHRDRSGALVPTIINSYSPKFPRLIICEKYNPGIPIAEMMDVDAINFALSEIERLTTENKDLKRKVELESVDEFRRINAELATASADMLAEIRRMETENKSLRGEVILLGSIVRDLENWDDDNCIVTTEVIE